MRIGTIVYISDQEDIAGVEERYSFLHNQGFECLHIVWNNPELYTFENANHFRNLSALYDLPIINFTPAMRGPMLWDINEGPVTNGLLPPTYRQERTENILRGSEFCAWMRVETLSAHIGFLPVNKHDPDYIALVATMKHILRILHARGQRFLIETGQEAPIILHRALKDIGEPNLFVNFDPGNIIMSGLGEPLVALETLKGTIQGFHAKDGKRGHDVSVPEQEMRIGEGDADFVAVLHKLINDHGYCGDIVIEREVDRSQRDEEIILELEWIKRFLAR